MSAALLAALVLAAAPPPLTPGAFSVELTRPRDDGPALLRHLEWASLVEPELSPQRIQRRVSAAFGPELWSESGLARWGVAKDRPMRFHDRGGAPDELHLMAALDDALPVDESGRIRKGGIAEVAAECLVGGCREPVVVHLDANPRR